MCVTEDFESVEPHPAVVDRRTTRLILAAKGDCKKEIQFNESHQSLALTLDTILQPIIHEYAVAQLSRTCMTCGMHATKRSQQPSSLQPSRVCQVESTVLNAHPACDPSSKACFVQLLAFMRPVFHHHADSNGPSKYLEHDLAMAGGVIVSGTGTTAVRTASLSRIRPDEVHADCEHRAQHATVLQACVGQLLPAAPWHMQFGLRKQAVHKSTCAVTVRGTGNADSGDQQGRVAVEEAHPAQRPGSKDSSAGELAQSQAANQS